MTDKKAKLGETVLVKVDPRRNNGSDEAPATIVNVLDAGDDEQRVNLRVLMDSDENLHLRNVKLLGSRPDDDEELGPENIAYWPSRH